MKNVKKVISMLLVAVLCLGVLAACGSKDKDKAKDESKSNAPEKTIDISGVKLINDGVLTVGCEAGYPPFEDIAKDGVTPIGYDIDIITEVANRLGLKVNIINTAWDGIFAGIDVNYDVVCSAVTITPDRKETMIFSTPYINNYQAVVVPKGSKLDIKSFKDLDKMTIALQKETTSDILMSDYKSTGTIDIEIVANEKVTTCFTQLTNGEVDAVVVDSTVADGYIAREPEKYTIIFKDESEFEQFGIAMGKKNTALQKAINEALADMEADGFIAETYDYWFGSGTK